MDSNGEPVRLTWWDKIWTYPWALGVVIAREYQRTKAINAEVRGNVSWCLDDDVLEDVLDAWTGLEGLGTEPELDGN